MRSILWAVALLLLILSCKKENNGLIPIKPGTMEVHPDDILEMPISIVLNPTGLTPLAALAKVNSLDSTTILYELLGVKPLGQAFSQPAKHHAIPLLGLRAGIENKVVLTVTNPDGYFARDTLSITTDPLPDYFPDIEVTYSDLRQMELGMNLAELNIGSDHNFKTQPILFDYHGEIRWYILLDFTGDWTAPFERLRNGNFIFGRNSTIYEFDMLGRSVAEYYIEGYSQHHDIIEKPDGNLIAAVSKWSAGTGLDFIIEIDRQSKAIIREWDLRQILDIDRFDLSYNEYDWIHVNSIWYDERDESLLVSGRNQGMAKISKDNDLIWILAAHKGWGKAGVDGDGPETYDYLLEAVDEQGSPYADAVQLGSERHDDFDWPWGQHAAMLLPNGNIFVFDNGWHRHFASSTLNGYSRGVEYEVDEINMTVRQVWQYGEERGRDMYSGNISDVDFLPQTGNRLICPGNIVNSDHKRSKIIEVTHPYLQVVFEANIDFKNSTSTGGGWGSADLVYRSERLTLYPE